MFASHCQHFHPAGLRHLPSQGQRIANRFQRMFRTHLNLLVAQKPGTGPRTQVVRPSQAVDLLLDFGRRSQFGICWTGLAIDQSLISVQLVLALPGVIRLTADTEIPTGLGNIPSLLGVLRHPKHAKVTHCPAPSIPCSGGCSPLAE